MLLRAQLAVLVLLLAMNTWLGLDKELYFSIWWWDIPNHFLGGVWAALCAAWLYKLQKNKITVLSCAVFALAVGVAWEIFEGTEQIGENVFVPYWIDTTKDIVMDTLGGIAGGYMALRINKVWRK
jgi:hypothetical protein